MKLSKAQQNDLEVIEYFIPKNCDWGNKNDSDIHKFFEYSDQGKHKDDTSIPTYLPEGRTYFHALVWGKKRRGIHIHELWEPGVLEGSVPYHTLLVDGMPRPVVNFMKKEMFKGMDSDVIEKCYQSLI